MVATEATKMSETRRGRLGCIHKHVAILGLVEALEDAKREKTLKRRQSKRKPSGCGTTWQVAIDPWECDTERVLWNVLRWPLGRIYDKYYAFNNVKQIKTKNSTIASFRKKKKKLWSEHEYKKKLEPLQQACIIESEGGNCVDKTDL